MNFGDKIRREHDTHLTLVTAHSYAVYASRVYSALFISRYFLHSCSVSSLTVVSVADLCSL